MLLLISATFSEEAFSLISSGTVITSAFFSSFCMGAFTDCSKRVLFLVISSVWVRYCLTCSEMSWFGGEASTVEIRASITGSTDWGSTLGATFVCSLIESGRVTSCVTRCLTS